MLGRKKKDKGEKKPKADKKAEKKSKKKDKTSLLKKAGIEAEQVPDEKDVAAEKRHQQIFSAWSYVRNRVDLGCEEYFRAGKTDTLRQWVGRPAIDALLAELERAREMKVQWSFPDRSERSNARYRLINEKLDPASGKPVEFTVEERFEDHSVYSAPGGIEKVCPGTERVIQGTVEVSGGVEFLLTSVIEVKGATLN